MPAGSRIQNAFTYREYYRHRFNQENMDLDLRCRVSFGGWRRGGLILQSPNVAADPEYRFR